MVTYQVGDSPQIKIEVRDVDGTLTNPTAVVIYIRKPDGTLAVDSQAMNNSATGKYYYDYTVAAQVGTHYIKIKATGSGNRVSIQPGSLKVVESFEA